MHRTNIYLSEVQVKKLKAMMRKTGLGMSEIIRRLIDDGLKRFEMEQRRVTK